MLDQENDNGCWKLVGEGFNNPGIYLGNDCVLEAPGYASNDLESRVVLSMQVRRGTDHGVEQNDKDCSQRRGEEEDFGPVRILLGAITAAESNHIKHGQRGDAHGRIELGSRQIFKTVDDDHIRRIAVGAEFGTLSKQTLDLAGADVERGPCHESRNGRQRNKIDNKTQTSQAQKANNCAAYDGHG